MNARMLAQKAAAVLDAKKAADIRVLEVKDLTAIADYFVFAQGGSRTQVRALVDELEFRLKEDGLAPLRIEGYTQRDWVVMDYNTVVIHIFYAETRSYYKLEALWADGVPLPLPEELKEPGPAQNP